MLSKVLLAVCLFQGAVALGTWYKMGHRCITARNNGFKDLTYLLNQPRLVGAVRLQHTGGTVGCYAAARSFWGCQANHANLNIFITDVRNQLIYPSKRLVQTGTGGWYQLPGYTSTSPNLVFTDFGYPKYLQKLDKLRFWYAEDYHGFTEHDNHGYTCFNVWLYLLDV